MSNVAGVLFRGEVSRESVEMLMERLRKGDTPPRVLVDSPGGTFEFFSVLGPALSRQGFRAFSGDVRSAAVVLFLLGRRRYATPSSTFFFHDVRTIVEPDLHLTLCDAEEAMDRAREIERQLPGRDREHLQEWLRQMRMAQGWMLSFIQERTGLNAGVFANLMHAEATLSGREALRYGIVHRVISEEQAHFDLSL